MCMNSKVGSQSLHASLGDFKVLSVSCTHSFMVHFHFCLPKRCSSDQRSAGQDGRRRPGSAPMYQAVCSTSVCVLVRVCPEPRMQCHGSFPVLRNLSSLLVPGSRQTPCQALITCAMCEIQCAPLPQPLGLLCVELKRYKETRPNHRCPFYIFTVDPLVCQATGPRFVFIRMARKHEFDIRTRLCTALTTGMNITQRQTA